MGREMLLNAQHVSQPGLLSHTGSDISSFTLTLRFFEAAGGCLWVLLIQRLGFVAVVFVLGVGSRVETR